MSPPPRLLITGASGYIGGRLVEVAAARGVEVVVLGQAPHDNGTPAIAWRLGQAPDPAVFAGVTAVVHLGHSWASDTRQKSSPDNINLVGAEALARATFAAGVPRFVFASTTSASPAARNAYGRIKHAIEQRLAALPAVGQGLVYARIGLVYGGPERALFGLMAKLVRMTPILPIIGLDRRVQPIHVDEVCAGLLALALDPLPRRDGHGSNTYVLAGPRPLRFAVWLRLLRRAQTGGSMILVPIPTWAALLACDLTRLLPLVPTVDRERVLGLAGTEPMDSTADLAALEIGVADAASRLGFCRPARRRYAAEALAMLRYMSGRSQLPTSAIARLLRGIDRVDAGALGLPRLVLLWPALIRAFEPSRPAPGHRLADRLHLAAMVAECLPPPKAARRGRLLSLLGQGMLELAALPLRPILSRRYA
ncbi:MAG TPA: NAD-dependent epimerase/dehydratase family protein [Xanthobacteraceae bacterium]|nr:NAD-dependent epimerase/dehydratase family protein [Xanthobacteraceae bacterium]